MRGRVNRPAVGDDNLSVNQHRVDEIDAEAIDDKAVFRHLPDHDIGTFAGLETAAIMPPAQ